MQQLVTKLRPAAILIAAGLLFVSLASAQSTEEKHAAKMRAQIQKLGTGKNARIKLELRDGSRVRGYISEIKTNSFVLIGDQSGTATEIEYADAKRPSVRISKGVQYVIVAGVVIGIIAIIGWFGRGS